MRVSKRKAWDFAKWTTVIGLSVALMDFFYGILQSQFDNDKKYYVLSGEYDSSNDRIKLTINSSDESFVAQKIKIIFPGSLNLSPIIEVPPFELEAKNIQKHVVDVVKQKIPVIANKIAHIKLPLVIGVNGISNGAPYYFYSLCYIEMQVDVIVGEGHKVTFKNIVYGENIPHGENPLDAIKKENDLFINRVSFF